MKVLLLLFLVGCATAFVVHNDNAVEEDQEFMAAINRAEVEAKTELGKKLQAMLDALLEKMKKDVEQGENVKDQLIEKFKEVRAQLDELKMKIGHKARELIEIWKEKTDSIFDYILGKKESHKEMAMTKAHLDLNFKDMFKKLKDLILSKIDKELLKAKIEEIFGKGSEMADSLLEHFNDKSGKYKQRLLDFIDRYLEQKVERKRSISGVWEKIKDYFKNLHIDLKEKFTKFGEWVKDNLKHGLENSKDKMENIKAIATEFIKNAKGVSKEVAEEALEFMRPYKDDLGLLWEQMKETVRDISNRKN